MKLDESEVALVFVGTFHGYVGSCSGSIQKSFAETVSLCATHFFDKVTFCSFCLHVQNVA